MLEYVTLNRSPVTYAQPPVTLRRVLKYDKLSYEVAPPWFQTLAREADGSLLFDYTAEDERELRAQGGCAVFVDPKEHGRIAVHVSWTPAWDLLTAMRKARHPDGGSRKALADDEPLVGYAAVLSDQVASSLRSSRWAASSLNATVTTRPGQAPSG